MPLPPPTLKMDKDLPDFSPSGDIDPAKLAAEGDLLADELRDALVDGLRERLDALFAKAGEMAATRDSGGQDFRSAMHALLSQRDAVTKAFLAAVGQRFDRDAEQRSMTATIAISFEELSLQQPESLEENIATTNVGNRGELIYEHQMWELRQRMEWWRDDPNPRVSDKSLAPYAICRSFFDGLRPLGFETENLMLIFWQFDRYVMRQLHDVYDHLIELFDYRGFYPLQMIAQAAQSRQRPVAAESAAPPGVAPKAAAADGSVKVDPQTWRVLSQFAAMVGPGGSGGAPAAPGSYSDQALASDLTSLLSGQSVPGWVTPRQAKDFGGRTSAVGRAFNRIITDPHLARSIKPHFDNLRFAVLKTALSDPRFFRDRDHPVRGLINELADLATGSRLQGDQELDRMGHLLSEIHRQFEPQADQVRDTAGSQEEVSEQEIERFLDEQMGQQKRRREALIEKSRRVVEEEMWLQTATRRCPDSLSSLLVRSWAPMMALRLLRYGVNSKLWNQGVALLKRLVDAADPPPGTALSTAQSEQLCSDFSDQLRGVGMTAERVKGLVSELAQFLTALGQRQGVSRDEPDSRPLAAGAGSQDEWLACILREGAWFEVFDRDADTVRWMLSKIWAKGDDEVVFAEFGNGIALSVPIAQLIEDFRSGVSAPVDPTPRARAAMQNLLQGAAAVS